MYKFAIIGHILIDGKKLKAGKKGLIVEDKKLADRISQVIGSKYITLKPEDKAPSPAEKAAATRKRNAEAKELEAKAKKEEAEAEEARAKADAAQEGESPELPSED